MKKETLLARYNCGPVQLSGDPNAFYERHLTFDQLVRDTEATTRDKYEAIARSVRDVLSQRWLKTEETCRQRNVKRVYYLSMEFLLGRSLANNFANLMIDPAWQGLRKDLEVDPLQIIEQEPDAGLGNGGLGRLAACFLDSMATLGIPASATACVTNTACSAKMCATAGKTNSQIIGSSGPIRGKCRARMKALR